ncbi:hypothetical protein SAMN05446037_101156 [Anaerovirgula multivorans]|uniref:Uncharacterized protein n=1 Tax=Anaerovirgula multivorans TaxID=312168 RepID=A0A239EXZ1_9FIRM|nr:hypothetical protein SAMN05446037_101156 [Anaerovirgula multivorans]
MVKVSRLLYLALVGEEDDFKRCLRSIGDFLKTFFHEWELTIG